MNSVVSHSVRGWCPGALRPMESGDGLIVRIRPRCGAISVSRLAAIAELAGRHGSGAVDFTRRANIQIRGIRAETLPDLWQSLTDLDLLDENAEVEAVRNVLVSPLAGLDPSEVVDARTLASELEAMLAAVPALWRLPGKFGIVVDGGGRLTLDRERGDVRLKFVRNGGAFNVALGMDRPDGTAWLGSVRRERCPSVASEAAQVFLAMRPDARARMCDLTDDVFRELKARLEPRLGALPPLPFQDGSSRRLGIMSCDGTAIAVGLALPFGRADAKDLLALADVLTSHAIHEIRLSPWRAIYVPVNDNGTAHALATVAARHGFMIEADDPLSHIDACPGAPGCRSTTLNTHEVARNVAPLLAEMGCHSCHVSGCAKGCARSAPADLVLVGIGEGFGVLRHSTAQGHPSIVVPPARMSDVPHILKRL